MLEKRITVSSEQVKLWLSLCNLHDGFDPDEERDESGRWGFGAGKEAQKLISAAKDYQENSLGASGSKARSQLLKAAKFTIIGGKYHSLHPGAITIYRAKDIGRGIGNQDTSWTSNIKEARKIVTWAKKYYSREMDIVQLKLTRNIPAIDLNKLVSEKNEFFHESEVIVDPRGLGRNQFKVVDGLD